MKVSLIVLTVLVVVLGCFCKEENAAEKPLQKRSLKDPLKLPAVMARKTRKRRYVTTCPFDTTRCDSWTGSSICCPGYNAVCCSDGYHCCPEGYTCVKSGYSLVHCSKYLDKTAWFQPPAYFCSFSAKESLLVMICIYRTNQDRFKY